MVCIYDSGVGGLTALSALRAAAPSADIVYLGDTARVPYGTRSEGTVQAYARAALDHLAALSPEAVLVACGTVSTVALPSLLSRYSFPLVGVADAGISAALRDAPHGRIAVLGTEATVRSGYFGKEIERRRPGAEVREIACQLFVALAECGFAAGEDPVPALVSARYLAPLVRMRPEAILLGCTHFPWLRCHIARLFPSAALIDCGAAAAASLAGMLSPGGGSTEYLVTDSPEQFSSALLSLTGRPPRGRVTRISLST